MFYGWPSPTKQPLNVRDLLQMNKKMIEELHDRWTNPSYPWSPFTFDPHAVLEEIDLYLKENNPEPAVQPPVKWKPGREFI